MLKIQKMKWKCYKQNSVTSMKNTKIQTQRQSDGWTDGQTNGRYQTATDGLIETEINHELKGQKTQMDK